MRGPAEQQDLESKIDDEDMVAHLLIFTSSIANKGVASLLTAYLMNLFLWRDQFKGSSLAQLIRSQQEELTRRRMLKSILAETERLSPPVVGVMRRVKQDIVLHAGNGQIDPGGHQIPKGHDAWLYLGWRKSRSRSI